jgi:hypothetical protein
LGCLPRGGDSTRFEVDVIVDSLHDNNGGALWLIRRERAAARPGYIYQSVSVEVQRARQTRLVGTSCWHDGGIVVRSQFMNLAEARVYLDAPGTILVRVFDGHGTALVDSVRVDKESSGERISWTPPPRKARPPSAESAFPS